MLKIKVILFSWLTVILPDNLISLINMSQSNFSFIKYFLVMGLFSFQIFLANIAFIILINYNSLYYLYLIIFFILLRFNYLIILLKNYWGFKSILSLFLFSSSFKILILSSNTCILLFNSVLYIFNSSYNLIFLFHHLYF